MTLRTRFLPCSTFFVYFLHPIYGTVRARQVHATRQFSVRSRPISILFHATTNLPHFLLSIESTPANVNLSLASSPQLSSLPHISLPTVMHTSSLITIPHFPFYFFRPFFNSTSFSPSFSVLTISCHYSQSPPNYLLLPLLAIRPLSSWS